LIELLVVVAIIGVLAAAGVVGYTSYLDGVKNDTHRNNAKTIAAALKTVGVARSGGLAVSPAACADGVPADATPAAITAAKKTRQACAAAIATDGKFKSPFVANASPADYIGSGGACNAANAGKLLVVDPVESPAAEAKVIACNKDGGNYTDASYSDAQFGTTW